MVMVAVGLILWRQGAGGHDWRGGAVGGWRGGGVGAMLLERRGAGFRGMLRAVEIPMSMQSVKGGMSRICG